MKRTVPRKWLRLIFTLSLVAVFFWSDLALLRNYHSSTSAVNGGDENQPSIVKADLVLTSLDFRVPTNHSLNRYADFPFSSEISKREVDSFFLLVLLTGLKPHLDKNTSEYEKPGHQRNLHLLVQTINSQPPVSAQLLNRNYNLTC